MCDAIDRVARSLPAFDVTLGSGGGRSRRGDGVAWLDVDRGAAEITRLAASLEDAIGWRGGSRPSGQRPHLTVARRASPELIEALSRTPPQPPIAWRVAEVVLFCSHLRRTGAAYERLHESPLTSTIDA
ncbi:MAG: 2'-5' RNA ligase family protein [Chloroflexi bacterium]|nr:2'-5' RNA ligase family protein [Chloroflexota bacterium]